MSKRISHVLRKIRDAKPSGEWDPKILSYILATVEASRAGPFQSPQGSARFYPGEAEAGAIFKCLNSLRKQPREQKRFLKSLCVLQQFEEASRRGDSAKVQW